MQHDQARRLIAPMVAPVGGTWADLGAGTGTFTLALAELLGPSGRVIAVERDATSVRALERMATSRSPSIGRIEVVRADFTTLPALPALDGVLLANALHFVQAPGQAALLRALAARLDAGGRLALVEYDDRPASRWVPHPVSFARYVALAAESGLAAPERVGTLPSQYGGAMYAAFAVVGARER